MVDPVQPQAAHNHCSSTNSTTVQQHKQDHQQQTQAAHATAPSASRTKQQQRNRIKQNELRKESCAMAGFDFLVFLVSSI
jgi:hypothetical protein